MRITTKGRYGIRAVACLAGSCGTEPVSISSIARHEGLSPEFLEQIFYRLKKAGLIRSLRGPKGGFVLDRDPAAINIREILVAVDETLYPAPCVDERSGSECSRAPECPVYRVWRDLSAMVNDYFAGITVADLVRNGSARPDAADPEDGGREQPTAAV